MKAQEAARKVRVCARGQEITLTFPEDCTVWLDTDRVLRVNQQDEEIAAYVDVVSFHEVGRIRERPARPLPKETAP